MILRQTAASILAVGLAATVAACGNSTPAASSSVNPVTVTVTTPTPDTGTSTAPPTTTTPPRPGTPTTSTTGPQTRTQPAPSYVAPSGGTPAGGAGPSGGDLGAAVTRLRGLGFTPTTTGTWDPGQTLHVLVGGRTGSAHSQQAFFFDGGKYLGTDAASASGTISVTAHSDTDVTLRYGTYRPGDGDCCPTGAPVSVRFELDGGRLMALDPIPSATGRR